MMRRKLVGGGVGGFCGGVDVYAGISSVAVAGRGFVGGRRIETECSRNIYLERLGGDGGVVEVVFEN